MKSFRVILSHDIQESITLDIEAPDRETVETLLPDIHAQACEMPSWGFRWDSGTTNVRQEIEGETADHFDKAPDGLLRINEAGTVEAVPDDEDTNEDAIRRDREIRAKIDRALAKVLSCCLDNEEDRKRVVKALMEEL